TTGSAPSVSGLGTTSGYTTGGESITINGSNFTGATSVMFGSVAADYFTVDSDTQITAIVPPSTSTGTIDVQVSNYAGTSTTSSADRYTYTLQSAPTITGLSTSSGITAGGASVTLTGTGFENVDNVYFDGIAVSDFTVNSSTSITVTTPPDSAGAI